MIWDDTGFLLSKHRYNENSLISEIYTKNHGKVSGIIFGGTSKKIKSYLQIGNKIHVNFNSKSENRIGYFKIEIQDALSPKYFDNHQKLTCISSALNLIKILNAESQKNNYVYELIENFFILLDRENWLKDYIYWELELFKALGYDLTFDNLVEKDTQNNSSHYITKTSSHKKIVPSFLVNKNEYNEDLSTLLIGLKLVGDYLEKTILKPNNLSYPITRSEFINTLK